MKKALALVLVICKCHQYNYLWLPLHIYHRPQATALNSRVQAMSTSSGSWPHAALGVNFICYTYDIMYRSTKENANGDSLSRLPLKVTTRSVDTDSSSILVSKTQALPVETCLMPTPILSTVQRYICNDWPQRVPVEYKPYHNS